MDDAFNGCRRINYIQAAYVEAAIRINQMFGSDRAYWILIREKVPPAVIDRILRGKVAQMRRQDRRYSTRGAMLGETKHPTLPSDGRVDQLTSQRVEVALVFQSMLGTNAASEYLRNAGVPVWVTARVLGSTKRRPSAVLVTE
jgi:hypothetical protein